MHPDRLGHGTASEDARSAHAKALYRLAESADYVSQRVLQLDDQIREAEQSVQQMQALVRQLRTLASNTTLEATRMKMGGPLAEIARQMRRISQRIGESSEQLTETMRAHSVATGELRQAASTLVVDMKGMLPEAPPAGMPSPVRRAALGLADPVPEND
jgi:cell division septum initiation protein DivIVA